MANFEVKWSGKFPALCDGEWTIRRNGVDVSEVIPEDLRDEPMFTLGEYSEWHFNESDMGGLDEEWESYSDGLPAEEWIPRNRDWVDKICETREEKLQLFHAIQAEDWRRLSCGGCI